MTPYEIRVYADASGATPFTRWLERLRDRQAVARIAARLDRLATGNFGDHRAVGGGVYELRVDWGAGYRVYFARSGRVVLLLLCGGDKSSQQRDIERAKAYLQNYQRR